MLTRVTIIACVLAPAVSLADHPLSDEDRTRMVRELDETIAAATRAIEINPSKVEAYSRRGDANFFRGRFADAVADYDKTVELAPETERKHWRRGIALFYAGRFEKAAKQFEMYHSFDNIDRENGIWRYLSQVRSAGHEEARKGLLKYEKDDREPFRDIYRLFSGEIAPEAILEKISKADVTDEEREKRLFYANLYIGLNHAIEDKPALALPHLRAATASPWPRSAGYGPRYMWHVGRLHFEMLQADK
jgi:lipoprotein NlpI